MIAVLLNLNKEPNLIKAIAQQELWEISNFRNHVAHIDIYSKDINIFKLKGIHIAILGEIININSLNKEDKFSFKRQEEFFLQFYKKYGFEKLHLLKGHFLIVLFEEQKQKIFIATDHFGSFPFYYSKEKENIVLSTHLKPLFDFGLREKIVNKSAVADFFVYRYIPAPKTIWQNIHKIPAASIMEINTANFKISERVYWDIQIHNTELKKQNPITYFDELFQESILNHAGGNKNQASFLSGGYDSSAIVYYLKKMHFNVLSFSLGFANWEKSEDYYAEKVAKHLKITNNKQVLNEKSLNFIDNMPVVYEEPLADISIIPSFIAAKLASKNTNKVFSGEGADEILAGYHWQKEYYNKEFPKNWKDKIKKYLLGKENVLEFYAQAMGMGYFDEVNLKDLLHEDYYNALPDDVHWYYKKHFKSDWESLKAIQYLDMKCFMGALVLPKITFATRANNLKIAMPFLDPDIYNFIFNLPIEDYFKNHQTKYLLYENIKEGLPKEVLERKKQGFVGPDAYYMQMDWYEKQLKNSTLVKLNIIKQSFIDKMLEEDYNWKLWKILVLEKWAQKWL